MMVTTDDTNIALQDDSPVIASEGSSGSGDSQGGTSPVGTSVPVGDFTLEMEETTTSPAPTTEVNDFVLDIPEPASDTSSASNFDLWLGGTEGGETSSEESSTASAQDFSLNFDDPATDSQNAPSVGIDAEHSSEVTMEQDTVSSSGDVPSSVEWVTSPVELSVTPTLQPSPSSIGEEDALSDGTLFLKDPSPVSSVDHLADSSTDLESFGIVNSEQPQLEGALSMDELFEQPAADQVGSSSGEYQPTTSAFEQTVSALQDAKSEGNVFLSSDDLPSDKPIFSGSSSQDTKMLDLDQMVAKFHGDALPIEQDPFEPMKKALEEEEKKILLGQWAIVDGVPLVVAPDSSSPAPVVTPSEPVDVPLVESVAEPETSLTTTPLEPPIAHELAVAEVDALDEPLPETSVPTPSLQEAALPEASTFSLDDIGDTPIPAVLAEDPPVSETQISTSLDMGAVVEKLKKPQVWGSMVGGLLVIIVLFTMFPSTPSSRVDGTTNQPSWGTIWWELPSLPNWNHSSAVEQPTVVDPGPTTNGNGGLELGNGFGVIDDPNLFPIDTTPNPNESFPFVDDPYIDTPQPLEPVVSVGDMTKKFNTYYNIAVQYLEEGRRDNDSFLIKNASYVSAQADVLRNRLESGESLDIDYYMAISDRMSTLLDTLQAYLDGTYVPSTSQTTSPANQGANRQELQDYIYSQSWIF